MADCDMELGAGWEREIAGRGSDWETELEKTGMELVARAVPHSGVDTSDLIQSMGYAIVEGANGAVELVAGSNPETGQPVPYAGAHWVGGKEGAALDVAPAGPQKRRRRVPHPTKPAPTKPWTRAQQELFGAAPYGNLPGGLEG